MSRDGYVIQQGLFGPATVVDNMHVVQAHTRLLPGGGSTFVAEHLRWNRGRTAAPPGPGPRRRRQEVEDDQLTLWDGSG